MQGKSRRRLLGLLLLALAMSPRPALSQLVEVRVLLDVLRVGYLDDGCVGVFCLATDRTVEAFGTIRVDGVTVRWNTYPCGAGWGDACLSTAPVTTDVGTQSRIGWRDQFLSVGGATSPRSAAFRRSNHVFSYRKVVLFGFRPTVDVSFQFRDRDRLSADDTWCEARNTIFGLEGRFEIRDPIVTQPVRTSPPLPRCRLVIRLSNTIVRP